MWERMKQPTLEVMQWKFRVFFNHFAHEELASEVLRLHEGSVLGDSDLKRRELDPFLYKYNLQSVFL